jgi:uncharacterized membrane protein
VLRYQAEMMRLKSDLRRSWFERESMASIVGALLLMVLGATVVISMSTHTAASQIVTSSFLIVLGYFFGQSGSNHLERRRTNKEKSDIA